MADRDEFRGDMSRNEVEMELSKFMDLIQENADLKAKIVELTADSTINPWQKWIHLAKAIDSWRIFPRIFVGVYIFLLYKVVMWFMELPDPNIEQSALVSIVVGAMAAVFGIYAGTSGQSKKFKGEDN